MLINIAAQNYQNKLVFRDNLEFICMRNSANRFDTINIAHKLIDTVKNCFTIHLFGVGKSSLNVDNFNATLIGAAYAYRLRVLNKTDYYN
jgi:hypothetical protein